MRRTGKVEVSRASKQRRFTSVTNDEAGAVIAFGKQALDMSVSNWMDAGIAWRKGSLARSSRQRCSGHLSSPFDPSKRQAAGR
jgi:hypothetical protein